MKLLKLSSRRLAASLCLVPLLAVPAFPDATGVWKTQADSKGQTAFVTSKSCGNALCGTITQVMNASGEKIDHPNVGRRVFWDMQKVSPGLYEGKAYVPALDMEAPAKMALDGGTMKVSGCLGPICKSQTWTRAR